MAIIGPNNLPALLKVDSNPLKLRTLHHFGYPSVRVELTEDQFEHALRFVGDFISRYFPQEERYAYWYTQPLQAEYDLPADAYWVREVAWDPVITRITDVFSAEMFLFCAQRCNFHVLTSGGIKFWRDLEDGDRLVSPYGCELYELTEHDVEQPIVKVTHERGSFSCTPNQPIKVGEFAFDDCLDGWTNASELKEGNHLVTFEGLSEVFDVEEQESGPTVTVDTPSGCFYACSEGEPILVH